MRTIKFRGLRTDSNEWVYGSMWNHSHYGNPSIMIGSGTTASSYNGFEVIPESVGQFTGLFDKKSKEVYEGDIFKINGKIYFVEWNEDKAGFILTTGKGYDTSNMLDFDCDSIYHSEITGSIHATPELLKRDSSQ